MFHGLFFLQLEQSSKKYSVEIHVYCLMDNHYHLLVKTPKANLDQFMQHFASGLSRQVNQKMGADGALFRSRYRSILVKSNHYYVTLAKYIHFNPVKAEIVEKPEDYKLSSYRIYCEIERTNFLKTKELLGHFNDLKAFKEYHVTEAPKEIYDIFSNSRLPDYLE